MRGVGESKGRERGVQGEKNGERKGLALSFHSVSNQVGGSGLLVIAGGSMHSGERQWWEVVDDGPAQIMQGRARGAGGATIDVKGARDRVTGEGRQ